MRLTVSTFIVAVATGLCVPAIAAAQEPVKSFDQLNTRLKVGDTVWVTDAQGRELKGKVDSLSPDALTLKADGFTRFSAGDLRMVRERGRDSLANGALIGLGIGGAFGIMPCWAYNLTEGNGAGFCAFSIGLWGAIGAGLGAGIDAMMTGKPVVVYRAPGQAESRHSRLLFAPVITPRAKGAAVSFAF